MSDSIDPIVDIYRPVFPKKVSQQLADNFSRFLEETTSDNERKELLDFHAKAGESWGFQPRHPLATKLMVLMAKYMLDGTGHMEGEENCKKALALSKKGEPVIMIGNHLSYGDVNYMKILLEMNGVPDFPLLVMAGPKVYSDPFRRIMSMAFDTLKMAQPPSRASEGANVSPRELAIITRTVMTDAQTWLAKGRILWFFPEGSRSRSGAINAFIPASARYLDLDNATIFPVGFSGSEGLLGVDNNDINAASIAVRVGKGVKIETLRKNLDELAPGEKRKQMMDRLGFCVSEMLDPELRGYYDPKSENVHESLLPSLNWYLTARR